MARSAFVDDMSRLGYSVRHEWRNHDKDMRLPFHEGYDVEHFSGFCFEKV